MTAPKPGWLNLPPSVIGALWVILAGVMFVAMSFVIKALGTRLGTLQIAFCRGAFGIMFVMPLLLRHGAPAFISRRPRLIVARSLLSTLAFSSMVFVLPRMPIADVTAISFAAPLFVMVLAVIFLGEQIRLRRSLATVVGFAGVILMMRPTGVIELAAFVALFAAFLRGCVTIMIKLLGEVDRPETIVFYFSGIIALILSVPAFLDWVAPTVTEWLLLASIGFLATGGQLFMVRAYRYGEATAIAPFSYLQIIFAGLGGYLLFAEVPDILTIVGASIIVASTAYIARRESRLGRDPAKIPES